LRPAILTRVFEYLRHLYQLQNEDKNL
jgi:hypothetical protein